MSGALVDLVAKGAQDVYLTGKPEVSFFRSTYKRHTNFSFRPYLLDYTGTFKANSDVVIKIPPKGDLLSYIWIENEGINMYTSNRSLFREDQKPTEIELYIGGQLVDRQDSLFSSFVWPFGGYSDSGSKVAISDGKNISARDTIAEDFYPLHFFFCDSFKNALPLVALQYHEVEIRIKCRGGTFDPIPDVGAPKIYANYIFLDTDERQHFVDVDHQILIPQVQRLPVQSTEIDLSILNHPVQSLHLCGTNAAQATFDRYNLYINGTPLHEEMSSIWSRVVSLYHHSKYLSSHYAEHQSSKVLYNIPFALTTSWSQPSGSVNFSRLDNAKLQLSNYSNFVNQYLYAVNWNVLRVKNGMAGLAFSN